MRYLATGAFSVSRTPWGGWVPGGIGLAWNPDYTVNIGGIYTIVSSISMSANGCSSGYFGGGGGGAIYAASTKCNCNGSAVMRNEDVGVCNGILYFFIWTMACACTLTVSAGQSKVEGN